MVHPRIQLPAGEHDDSTAEHPALPQHVHAPLLDRRGKSLILTVIVPVHGNATTLRDLHRRVMIATTAVEMTEIVFVDDASADDSWSVISAIAAADERVSGIRLERNVGQQFAVVAGVDHARGDVLAVMDADLEHPPEALPDLLAALEAGADLAIARRRGAGRPLVRRVASGTLNGIATLLGVPGRDRGSSYLAFDRSLAAPTRRHADTTRSRMLLPAMVRLSSHTTWVWVTLGEHASSSYSFRALIRQAWNFAASVGPIHRLGTPHVRRTTREPLYVVSDRTDPPGSGAMS